MHFAVPYSLARPRPCRVRRVPPSESLPQLGGDETTPGLPGERTAANGAMRWHVSFSLCHVLKRLT